VHPHRRIEIPAEDPSATRSETYSNIFARRLAAEGIQKCFANQMSSSVIPTPRTLMLERRTTMN